MSSPPRRPWIAALLAACCNGLGHLYAAGLRPALAVFGLWLALSLGMAAALRAGPAAFGAALGAAFVFWIGQAVHAAETARRRALEPRGRASHPLALLAFFAGTTLLANVVLPPLRARAAHTLYAASGSMIPTIQIGDVFAVAAGIPSTLRGAVIEFEAPPGASSRDAQVKRVVAVGGDTVELREGALWVNGAPVSREPVEGTCAYQDKPESGGWREQPCTDFVEMLDGRSYHTHCTPGVACGDVERQVVPAGHVWVAGDHRDRSADSRVFGPIPERTILGEVRWVMLSWGPRGPRWDRIGRKIR